MATPFEDRPAYRRRVRGELLSPDRRRDESRGADRSRRRGRPHRGDGDRCRRHARRDLAHARAHRSHRRHRRGASAGSTCRCTCIRSISRTTRGCRRARRRCTGSTSSSLTDRMKSSPRARRSPAARCDFEVMHVPGHAPGLVAFNGHGVSFGGDLLFAGSIGRTDLPLGNPADMDRVAGALHRCARGRRHRVSGPRAVHEHRQREAHEPLSARRGAPHPSMIGDRADVVGCDLRGGPVGVARRGGPRRRGGRTGRVRGAAHAQPRRRARRSGPAGALLRRRGGRSRRRRCSGVRRRHRPRDSSPA